MSINPHPLHVTARSPRDRVSRNRPFDLMRLGLAACVLLSHAPELTDGNPQRELLYRLTRGGMTFGAFGVHGFFLLSGFLITQSWARDPNLRSYLGKRMLRILPGYLVAVALSILVVGALAPAVPHFFHVPGLKAIASVLLLGSPLTRPAFPGAAFHLVNGALWSITYEVRCYLLLAAAGLAGLLGRRWVCLLLTAALLGLMDQRTVLPLLWKRDMMLWGDPVPLFPLLACFGVGACFFLFRERIPFRTILVSAAAAGLALVIAVAPRHTELAVCVFGSYGMFYLAHLRVPALDRLRFPDVSYGLYLYGWPVQSLWLFFLHGSPWLNFAGSLTICFALGWLSWHFVERPMLKLKRHPTAALPPG